MSLTPAGAKPIPTGAHRVVSLRCPLCQRDHFYITDQHGQSVEYDGNSLDLSYHDIHTMMQPCGICARLADLKDPEYVNRLPQEQKASVRPPADTIPHPADPDTPSPVRLRP